MSDELRIERHDGWRKLVFNRPDKLNAANPAMLNAVLAALDEAETDRSCRALLLTGEGRGFCAGQELGPAVMPGPNGPPDLAAVAELHHRFVRRLRAIPLPVVCAVNGVAAGAGANLALACDIVIAARSATFLQAFCRIGLIPDTGGTWFLPRLAGSARAMGMMLLGEPLPAATAAEWGLIWKVVEDDKLMEEARSLAAKLARGPTVGLGLIKEALNRSLESTLAAQLDAERDLQRIAARSPDFQEGVAAFLEKRPARFTGR